MSKPRTRSIRALSVVAAFATVFATVLTIAPAGAGGNGGNDDSSQEESNEAFATIGKIYSETVEIKKKDSDEFTSAAVGDELKVGDTVRTGETGRVRIDYDDDSFTRLDFQTTFTIKKLADDQGNRQVEGSLDDGNAWHRAEEITESESFEQTGAGATAAVVGTAFAIECDSPTHCVFKSVLGTVEQTGTGEVVNLLNPFQVCEATSGALCSEVQTLTLAQMIEEFWTQYNLWLDMIEFGLGPGPFGSFSGTLVVEDGVIVSFTPDQPGGGGTTPPVNVVDPNPIGCEFGCDGTSFVPLALPEDFEPGSSIQVFVDDGVNFVANLTVSPTGLFIVFTSVGSDVVGRVNICPEGCGEVEVGEVFDADTVFTFLGYGEGETSFAFRIQDANGNVVGTSPNVPVTVVPPSICEICLGSVPASQQAPAEPSPADQPPATDPDPPPPADEPPPPSE